MKKGSENGKLIGSLEKGAGNLMKIIAETARDGLVMIDSRGQVVFWNPAAERIFGYKPEEVLGKNLHQIIASDEAMLKHMQAIDKFQETGKGMPEGQVLNLKSLKRNGSTIRIQLSISSFSTDGEWHAFGIIRDETERFSHLEKLQEQAGIIEAVPIGIAIMSEGMITYANRRYEEIHGYEDGSIIGSRYQDLCEGICMEDVLEKLKKEGFYSGEIFGKRRDGSIFHKQITLKLSGDKVACIADDVSRERELQRKMAQASRMEAIGSLAAGIAHDFNNLLGVILGSIDLAKMNVKENPDDARKFLEMAVGQVGRGRSLTEKLLKLAKPKGQKILTCYVENVIEEATSLFSQTHKSIVISMEFDRHLLVDVDPNSIYDSILNLLINAVQAGANSIFLKTEKANVGQLEAAELSVSPGNYVRILIQDNGSGMPDEIRRNVFDPFFTTKTLGGGTGLGLAIVYSTIKEHGGWIDLESQLGEGTTFSILLPVSKNLPEKMEFEEREVLIRGTGTILLVDDEEEVLEINKACLEAIGYKVRDFRQAKKALEFYRSLEEQSIDLIVLDMIMPQMNGLEAFKQIRAINPQSKVLFLSGYGRVDDWDFISSQGNCAILQKPITLSNLSKAVSQFLEK